MMQQIAENITLMAIEFIPFAFLSEIVNSSANRLPYRLESNSAAKVNIG